MFRCIGIELRAVAKLRVRSRCVHRLTNACNISCRAMELKEYGHPAACAPPVGHTTISPYVRSIFGRQSMLIIKITCTSRLDERDLVLSFQNGGSSVASVPDASVHEEHSANVAVGSYL